MPRQTYFAKASDVTAVWRHVDAEGLVLGRLASRIAVHLMGKHLPTYTPHVVTGDFVIVTNASKVVLTGRKPQRKLKLSYSGYPSGQKAETYGSLLKRRPEFVLEDAVRRMLPKSVLARKMLRQLKVYPGPDHPHQAQQPIPLHVEGRP
jgi:large subunit ribosomal protein L13